MNSLPTLILIVIVGVAGQTVSHFNSDGKTVKVKCTLTSQPVMITDKLEQITPNMSAMLAHQEFPPMRSPLVDTLFNVRWWKVFSTFIANANKFRQIPIQTLRAVNELVQNIAGNWQAVGAQRRPERHAHMRHPGRGRSMDDNAWARDENFCFLLSF